MRDGKGVDPDGRGSGKELGGVEGGESVIRVYYMRKESIFNRGDGGGDLAQQAPACLTCVKSGVGLSVPEGKKGKK